MLLRHRFFYTCSMITQAHWKSFVWLHSFSFFLLLYYNNIAIILWQRTQYRIPFHQIQILLNININKFIIPYPYPIILRKTSKHLLKICSGIILSLWITLWEGRPSNINSTFLMRNWCPERLNNLFISSYGYQMTKKKFRGKFFMSSFSFYYAH